MPCRARILIVGLLLAALTAGLVQALPTVPQSRPAAQDETCDLAAAFSHWLSSAFDTRRVPLLQGTVGTPHGSSPLPEKEGSQLDPNGHK
jgi:hypothetical protein